MRSRWFLSVVIVTVFALTGWQVYGLTRARGENNQEVLAAATPRTLEERVAALESRVAVLERNTGLVKPNGTGKLKEQFVNLTGGSVTASDWTAIAGTNFSLDTALYGNSVEVSWQGWIDNGYGSVRIFDDTNHRVVDNSEIGVDSGVKSSFYSKPLSIWRGQNQYHVEGKNPQGELELSSPRLRIVTR